MGDHQLCLHPVSLLLVKCALGDFWPLLPSATGWKASHSGWLLLTSSSCSAAPLYFCHLAHSLIANQPPAQILNDFSALHKEANKLQFQKSFNVLSSQVEWWGCFVPVPTSGLPLLRYRNKAELSAFLLSHSQDTTWKREPRFLSHVHINN